LLKNLEFKGCQDINLSNEGILQADYLSKRFVNNFDFIYTSSLKRAVQTADIITKNSNTAINVVLDLRKINFGAWEGLTIKEIETNFPKKFMKWKNDELNGPMCGGDLSPKKQASVLKMLF